ncbi:hypothetical protein B9Z55_002857 [Caenorhabditis nigoni]|uniref:Uncharacterized protein n=1 Tax=Caenorhabditis nigoni TaxID=1611254 RepID=A0A2G5VMG2_9PELO|nr:hypothetical protein B9Z55_002857 [Caenorhabditis nigoni]
MLELAASLGDVMDDIERIALHVKNIGKFEDQWRQMRQRNPEEDKIHSNYVEEFGDYMQTAKAGESRILAL